MTYEAAAVLPALLFCLVPIIHKALAVEWRYALRQTLLMNVVLLVFWVIRAGFLGTFTARVNIVNPDLFGNFTKHFEALGALAWQLGGTMPLCWLAATLPLSSLAPRLFPIGPCLFAIAVLPFLPYTPNRRNRRPFILYAVSAAVDRRDFACLGSA